MAHADFFKDHYFAELARRDELNSSLSFPVGLVALLASASIAMLASLTWPFSDYERTLAIFLSISFLCLVIATVFLIRSYWGYTYKHVPFSEDLLDYRENLKTYFEAVGHSAGRASEIATAEFYADIDRRYAQDCKVNALNNDSKSANIFRANSFIIAAIAALLLAAPAYGVLAMRSESEPQKIEIVNLKEIAMSQHQSSPPAQEQKPVNPPKEPTRPSMPPSRDIKEHVDPSNQGGG